MTGFLSLAVGDALGVPAQFKDREYLRRNPVTTMTGYGAHNQPPGTWSDDTSMTLCTVESLLGGFDLEDMGRLFVRWVDQGYWTPYGRAFDVGKTTLAAIYRLRNGVPASRSGEKGEYSNGNGSLMRMLPVILYFCNSHEHTMLDAIHRTSAITHAHPRSMVACGLFGLMVRGLVSGLAPRDAYLQACQRGRALYAAGAPGTLSIAGVMVDSGKPGPVPHEAVQAQLRHFDRFLGGEIASLDEASIRSGGYVVHTLEASVWCLLNSCDLASALLKAVNLGGDTDTTACVTGALTGVHYGDSGIPPDWLKLLARREDIEDLSRRFFEAL